MLATASAALLTGEAATVAQAQTFTVLYSFTGVNGDGTYPAASLVLDQRGNLYGTTQLGGTSDMGTVFKVDPSGNETVLYSFKGGPSDGKTPLSVLVLDQRGNLYGTTMTGGTAGKGTVFKLDTSGKETVLHSFTGSSNGDGDSPMAGLWIDKRGNLYGTTPLGGSSGRGTVFRVDSSGHETVLYSFTGANGGGTYPMADLIMDHKGNLYGTTSQGGSSGWGTVFKLDPSGTETVLHSFAGSNEDGALPTGALIMDKRGNLYGTTQVGGSAGVGTVFQVDNSGKETVLHSFRGGDGDGAIGFGALVMDKRGNLYGATTSGGPTNSGTLFKVSPSGSETVLQIFPDSVSGAADPVGSLIMDRRGNLYGATVLGGSAGYGTVFRLVP